MIDFIRVHYSDKRRLETSILKPELFPKIYSVLEMNSTEILYPYKTNLENMEIAVNETSGYVKNSMHKLNNLLLEGDGHNHNDFNYSQLCSTVDYLKDKIIDITTTKLTQLEFGLNIRIPVEAKDLISKSILMHKLERHSAVKKFKGNGYLLMFEHYNYIIKIYDKAKQYGIKDKNILRFEIKFISQKEFNKLGVFNINDLKNKEKLNKLFHYSLNRFEELLIVDDFSFEVTGLEDFEKLNMYSSFSFWEQLTSQNKRQKKMTHKNKYLSLLKKHNLLKEKNYLRNQLITQFNHLITN
ncbi:hypothetical protein [Flavobacterium chilense]|uniref:Uncharacterized protein n=1 Tax=Flavobacterium chilense TaxID=946677 RepID=A0A1M7DUN4_9FLAO|nr:hypothetical protein [Flavobacterium chilense]SHL83205.1 hypothetical protein SAMN05444484_102733 [Flavobacterium chilense]